MWLFSSATAAGIANQKKGNLSTNHHVTVMLGAPWKMLLFVQIKRWDQKVVRGSTVPKTRFCTKIFADESAGEPDFNSQYIHK